MISGKYKDLVTSIYPFNKPEEGWCWPAEILQQRLCSRCLDQPLQYIFYFKSFFWCGHDLFWSNVEQVLIVHGFCSGLILKKSSLELIESAILQLFYSAHVWYWTSILWSIDNYQNKVSAEPYHAAISRAQVRSSSRSAFLSWPLNRCWVSIGLQAQTRLTYRKNK